MSAYVQVGIDPDKRVVVISLFEKLDIIPLSIDDARQLADTLRSAVRILEDTP